MWTDGRVFATACAFRIACCLLIQTSFVPDEYWQSLEPAHRLVFGYGYLTWEWQYAIRSYLHPLLFASVYFILSVLGLDSYYLILTAPRFLQSILTAIGDLYLYKLTNRFFGDNCAMVSLLFYWSNWFSVYCGPRTLSNCTETTVVLIGLYLYPWPNSHSVTEITSKRLKIAPTWKYISIAALSAVLRPTSALWWFPLVLHHFITAKRKLRFVFKNGFCVLLVVYVCTLIDKVFYGRTVFTLWNFFEFNFLRGQNALFGSHPWHWYISQGVPAVLGLHLIPVILGIRRSTNHVLFYLCCWYIIVHSLLSHKEFRFILPCLPLLCIYGGFWICNAVSADCGTKSFKWQHFTIRVKSYIILFVGVNVLIVLFVGQIHQRAPLDVMRYLRKRVVNNPTLNEPHKITFLMPCHSTPFYSHLHVNVSMRFLGCEPNMNNLSDYVEEADLFHANPVEFIRKEFIKRKPTLIVVYDRLWKDHEKYFDQLGFNVCERFLFSPFFEKPRQSAYINGTHDSTEQFHTPISSPLMSFFKLKDNHGQNTFSIPFILASLDTKASLDQGQIIRQRFRVLSKIGEGGFGSVYKVFDLDNNQSYAMKIESNQEGEKDQLLKIEMNILLRLQGRKHVCRFIYSGQEPTFNFLVMSLTDKTISELRKQQRDQKFTISTAFRIGKQCIQSIRDLHEIGYLHRDIKPSNFAMGRHDFNKKTVIMLDFGLARRFINELGEIKTPRKSASFRGTRRYASINALSKNELGRVDDLWCIFYMLIELLKGILPWKDVEKRKVADFKKAFPIDSLLIGCPSELYEFHSQLESYHYVDKPDYTKLVAIVDSILTRENVNESDAFDWSRASLDTLAGYPSDVESKSMN